MSDAARIGPRFRNAVRSVGLAIATTSTQDADDVPTLTTGEGAPNHTAADGSAYLRTDGVLGTTLYLCVSDVWAAISATAVSDTEYGVGGLATDVIAESTAATGVTIDGVLLKDEQVSTDVINELTAAAGVTIDGVLLKDSTVKTDTIVEKTGAAGVTADGVLLKDSRVDASTALTGVAGVTLADNLASAWDVKESTNSYLVFCTTNSAEAIKASKRLTTTDGVASGTARIVGGLALSDPAASTAVTGTTETLTNFDHGAYTIPADTLKVGTVVRVTASGIYTATTGAETHTFSVVAGAVVLAVTGAINPADNDVFHIEFDFQCRSTGATGTVVGSGWCLSGARATAAPAIHMLATGATSTSTVEVDTTGSLALAIAVDRQASATDSDSMRLDRFHVEVIG